MLNAFAAGPCPTFSAHRKRVLKVSKRQPAISSRTRIDSTSQGLPPGAKDLVTAFSVYWAVVQLNGILVAGGATWRRSFLWRNAT